MEAYKVIVLGASAVGKTSLINRYVHDQFALKYKMTIGVDFLTKSVEFEPSKFVKLHLWDIGGQERFKFLHRSFYKGTSGAVIAFDLSREQTYKDMKNWLSEMTSIMEENVPTVIIGNKSDLIPEIGQVINRNDIENYVKTEGCFYIETSAKTGENVELAFLELTKRMIINGRK